MTSQPGDLISLVLTLRLVKKPNPEAELPDWWGRSTHAFFLKIIRQTDENLSDDLHESGSSLRPFTTSSLIGYSSRRGLETERNYSLRLTGLNQEVTRHLWEASQPGKILHPGQMIELDYTPFEITANSILTSRIQEPEAAHQSSNLWSRQMTYQELSAPYLLAKTQPERQVSLKFASPTSWKSAAGMHIPLPLPELVFNSLLSRWNAFAPVSLPDEVRRYAAECLAISRYQLSSRVIPQKRGSKRIGCVGEVTYASVSYDRYWMNVIQMLADFALYSGVGISTTQGLGQCWRVTQQYQAPERNAED